MLIIGCWQPIDKDIPGFDAELVIQSTLTPDNNFNLSLSKTQSSLANAEVEPLVDADVKVFKGEELIAQLVIPASELGTNGPMFRYAGQKPEKGVQYNLEVEVDGFPQLTASTTIPEEVRVTNVSLNQLDYVDNFQDRNLKDISVRAELLVDNTDPGDHFYHLAYAELIFDWFTIVSGDTLFQEDKDSMLLPIENYDLLNENYISLQQEPGFLIMQEATGSTYLPIKFRIATQINPSNQVLSHLNVYLRHTSADYYKFHSSVTKQRQSNSIDSEPVPVHSNITNGQGHFSGYSTTRAVYLFR